MAAEYGININVRTKSEQLAKLNKDLKVTQSTAEKLKNELKQIGEQKGKGTAGGPFSREFAAKQKEVKKAVLEAKKAFQEYTRGLLNFDGQNRRSITSLGALAAKLQEARRETGRTTKEFALFTQGLTKIGFTQQLSSLKRFNEEAKITAKTFSAISSGNAPGITGFQGAGLSDLLAFKPANTINALEKYIATLGGVRNQLDLTEKDYVDVNRRIAEMNKLLQESRKLGLPTGKDKETERNRARLLRGSPTGFTAEEFGPQRGINRVLTRNPMFREGGLFAERGGLAARRRNALSSGLIGGGFPLLFGQGIGASIGGGLGGVAGGFLGGGLGFGLSIVGTQVGKQLDILVMSAKKAGDALADFNKDTTTLIASLGLTNSAFSQRIQLLEQAEGKEAAFNVVLARTTAIVGQDGVDALKEFGDQTRQITQGFSQFFLIVQAGLARIISFSRLLKGLGDGLQNLTVGERLRKSSSPELRGIGNRIAELEGKTGRLSGQERAELRGLKAQGITGLSDFDKTETNRLGFEAISKGMREEIELTNANTFAKRQKIKADRQVNDLAKEFQELTKQTLNQDQLELLREYVHATNELALGSRLVNDELVRLDEEFIKLNDSGFQIVELSKAIGSSFEESFKGVIKGTMSVQDAFRNMFSRIADHFLDMAARMMATQISKGIVGMFTGGFGNIFGGGPANAAPFITDNVFSTGFDTSLIGAGVLNFANGGRPPVGRASIVGERGPELFVPDRAGTIIPNHGMGSMNIVVNVDASGSNVEGDEEEGRALGIALSAAIETELIKQKRPGGLLA